MTTPGPSSMKTASYVEEENERSALLAAIRATTTSGRLRKVKLSLGYVHNITPCLSVSMGVVASLNPTLNVTTKQ